eukprot:CAMPEP_0202914016 /NCGR_PEP_ID=MMETSP1392-20130828/62013_1 /ASSEMBLY_ACC=CAM_ASM_000868 /TAXON_ID=225041 /ORGANISM="Chlamydomonas chlamydogama, Strain SAG 11-48b" /LENGTH=69 /DNA_ID=CAMNT_0049605501 /DNA_START=75 /DNA_END=281 /DNA_ORIENTATION=+
MAECSLPYDTIAQYAPVLKLHPGELYWPVSVEWFISKAEIWHCPDGVEETPQKKKVLLVPAGQASEEKI